MTLALLGHAPEATAALVQHENGLPYLYKFGPDIDTYVLVDDLENHIVPERWITNYPLFGNQFETIQDVKLFMQGFAAGSSTDAMWFGSAL